MPLNIKYLNNPPFYRVFHFYVFHNSFEERCRAEINQALLKAHQFSKQKFLRAEYHHYCKDFFSIWSVLYSLEITLLPSTKHLERPAKHRNWLPLQSNGFYAFTKLRRCGPTNQIIEDSDSKPSEFDCQLPYESDSKLTIKLTITILIKFWSNFN